ncbi:MAG: hypothetical protein RIA69_10540 [Cyclobacteriaceae bacterium]
MKVKVLIIGLILAGASACTQQTCPTYAKADAEKEVKTEAKV